MAQLRRQGRTGATLYGEKELGGLGVMYVLPDAPSRYPSLPADPEASFRTASSWQRAWQPAGAAVVLLGIVGLVVNFAAVSWRNRGRDEEGGTPS